jgi:hypothetical protein
MFKMPSNPGIKLNDEKQLQDYGILVNSNASSKDNS